MRLAIVRQDYRPDGTTERVTERALGALLERNVAVSLYTRSWPQTRLQLVEPRVFDPFHVGALWRDWSFARAVCRDVRRSQPRLVESHEQGASLPQRWRPQITRGAQQELQQLALGRPALPQVHVNDPLALRHVDLVHLGEHGERRFALDRLLLRVHLRGRADLPLGKEPLRLRAGLSAVPVIAPLHGSHGHCLLS